MEARGRKVPGPDLAFGLDLEYQGFFELSARRQYGMGANPISMEAIWAWLQLHEIVHAEREWFVHMFAAMDREWLEYVNRSKNPTPAN